MFELNDGSVAPWRPPTRLPNWLIIAVVALCALPAAANLAGFSFSSPHFVLSPATWKPGLPGLAATQLHRALAGSFLHTILEWTSVSTAVMTALLAFVLYRIKGGVVIPMIGMALLWSGCMDALHTLASDRLIAVAAESDRFIPFTWGLARLFTGAFLFTGTLAALTVSHRNPIRAERFILALGALFGLSGVSAIAVCAASRYIPQSTFPLSVVKRPWDLLVLAVFIGLVWPALRRLHRKTPSVFSHSLLIALIPQAATELYMAFGSSALYDNAFNIAHCLKVLAFAAPLCGLFQEYASAFRTKIALVHGLEQSQLKLSEARDRALEATRAKSEFLAVMSHEIRTPMNGVLNMTDLTLETDLSPQQREYLTMAKNSASSMLALINSILDFSKLEVGKMSIDQSVIGLHLLLDEIASPFGLRARRQGLAFETRIAANVPALVRADGMRLRQVLINLLENALKFTAAGQIQLNVSAVPLVDESCTVTFCVLDTGIGIPVGKQQLIFQEFTQAEDSTARHYGGTGLGLTISARLVELMGGSISLESQPGVGSSFSFALPLEIAPEPQPFIPEVVALTATPIGALVVDDNEINRKVAIALLVTSGHRAVAASSGEEALLALARESFDTVLMDVQMPGMNGYETTAAIRANEATTGKRLRIVAMTANALDGDLERCLAAGMDAYVAKPIRRAELLRAIAAPLLLNQQA